MTAVNYLDITLDLRSGTFKPYKKPGNEINYVHVQSYHPPSIIKQIPVDRQDYQTYHQTNKSSKILRMITKKH